MAGSGLGMEQVDMVCFITAQVGMNKQNSTILIHLSVPWPAQTKMLKMEVGAQNRVMLVSLGLCKSFKTNHYILRGKLNRF